MAVEDRPWWMQPLFSFPFIGDLSVRQLLVVSAFIIPSLLLTMSSGLGFAETVIILLVAGFTGLGLAKKPVKSVLPEKQLLLFITDRYRPKAVRVSRRVVEKRVPRAPETVEIVARDSTRIPTVKIVGVLRDPLGSPLAGQELEVYVNGRLYSRVKTGSSGEYTIYYSPEGPGLYDVEIRLQGRTILRKRVRVGVRG